MKITSEKWYNPNEKGQLSIQCLSFTTRNGWGHVARAWYFGTNVGEVKINYYNRTWERYEYEMVMTKLVGALDKQKTVSLRERLGLYKFIKSLGF